MVVDQRKGCYKMRYTCIIISNEVVIIDNIDKEVYSIKDLDIDELGYLNMFSSNILREEMLILGNMLETEEEKRTFNNRVVDTHRLPYNIVNMHTVYEEITSLNDKVISTSPIITKTIISEEIIKEGIDKVVVNNIYCCTLYTKACKKNYRAQSFQLVIKNKLHSLSIKFGYQNPIFITEKDLSKIKSIEVNPRIILSVIELNNDKPIKEIPHIHTLGVYADKRFSMLNLVNIHSFVNTFHLQAELYNIEEWFDQVRHIRTQVLCIKENGQILDWFTQLENSEYEQSNAYVGYFVLICKNTLPINQIMHKVYKSTHITLAVRSDEQVTITYRKRGIY